MKQHHDECQGEAEVLENMEAHSSEEPSAAPAAKRQPVMSDFLERKFSESEQKAAEMAQVHIVFLSGVTARVFIPAGFSNCNERH